MKAITIDAAGAPPQLTELPDPTPAAGQVLVRVEASSVNPLDGGIAAGMFEQMGMPHEYPLTLGRDVAGTVEAVGEGVTAFAAGDRVFGVIPLAPPIATGTWADLVVLGQDNLTRTPDSVDTATAGAAPLAALTAIQTVDALDLNKGDTLLVVGATGGVGSIVVQLAAHAGATILAPGLPEDEQFLRDLGVTEVLPRDGDVVAAVRERHPGGVDAIVDVVTGYTLTAYEAALADGGRIASPTNAAGEGAGRTNVMHTPTADLLARVAQHLAAGTITVPIQHTYELARAPGAMQAFSNGHTVGKIAVRIA
jgi:NADPH:quinone reductase-like Zn-dependent oxidoreductase